MIDVVARALGPWTAPPDGPAKGACALGILFLLAAAGRASGLRAALFEAHAVRIVSRRRFLVVLAFAAAFLSLGYVAVYLRGGPRVIDATAYWLQARALAEGKLAWAMPTPSASFRGRFLFTATGNELAGIFPPGYPLLLSIGFLLGAPLVIGPVLAGGIVVATYFLTREIAARIVTGDGAIEAIARLAAMASLFSAALRYHTADTMSHGAAALAVTTALALALRGRNDGPDGAAFLGAGLATGYVLATRFASALPIGLVTFALAATAPRRLRCLGAWSLGVLPAAGLLLGAQGAATGHLLQSTQLAYYTASDGPPGCFRYGFGAGIGCLLEHGDVVAKGLGHGFRAPEALLVTFYRLRNHAGDALNASVLLLFAFVPLGWMRKNRELAAIYAVLVLQVLAYAPFYFEGSYPGGGARFYADVLPLEHALFALGVALAFRRVAFGRKAALALAVSLLVFSVHRVHTHLELAARDGGRPMLEPEVLDTSRTHRGLLFVDTDHGFNLGYDPKAKARDGLQVARLRGDDRDRLLWDELGRPEARIYRYDDGHPHVDAYNPLLTPTSATTYRFEAEAEWPPLFQKDAWLEARWATGTCASNQRVAALTAATTTEGEAWLELPVPLTGRWEVTPTVMTSGAGAEARLELYTGSAPWLRAPGAPLPPPIAEWSWGDDAPAPNADPNVAPQCRSLLPTTMPLEGPRVYFRWTVVASRARAVAALDKVTVRRL